MGAFFAFGCRDCVLNPAARNYCESCKHNAAAEKVAVFQSENKKMQMPLFAARGGSELKNKDFRGRNFTKPCEIPAPFLTFKK